MRNKYIQVETIRIQINAFSKYIRRSILIILIFLFKIQICEFKYYITVQYRI